MLSYTQYRDTKKTSIPARPVLPHSEVNLTPSSVLSSRVSKVQGPDPESTASEYDVAYNKSRCTLYLETR